MNVAALGELRLKWRGRPDEEPAGKLGHYLGRGDGSFRARDLSGSVSWDLYENQGTRLCDVFFSGRIVGNKGGQVEFEILGYFRRKSESPLWTLTAAIRFSSDEPTFRHYHDRVGLVVGTFDMATYEHRHQVFLATDPPSSKA